MANKKSRKSVSKGKSISRSTTNPLVWLSLAIFVVVALCGMGWFVTRGYGGEERRVFIPAGSSAEAVSDSLKSVLGSSYGKRVYFVWTLMGGSADVAHGSYVIEPGQSALTTARRLRRGMQSPVRVGWSDVRTMDALAARVTRNLEISPEDFMAACEAILPDEGFKVDEFPAAFVPDTYEFYWTTSAGDVVRRLLDYRNRFWTDDRRAKAAGLGLSPVEVATLSSIVEEETAKADERPVIAGLYLNRLRTGMPLQADPTVKFATGDFGLRRILGEHLRLESPYNTYIHRGLPPGPIRVASKAAIDDVLNAQRHDYLYMCAKEDFSGRHNFAHDYATHMANARRYQAELNRRGIK